MRNSQAYLRLLPERMSWVELPIEVRLEAVGAENILVNLVVPVKLYGLNARTSNEKSLNAVDGTHEKILVCWIDENRLGSRPLSAISQVLEQLLPDDSYKKRIRVCILGPVSSDGLLTIAKEHAKLSKKVACSLAKYAEFAIYSPRATISHRSLTGEAHKHLESLEPVTPNLKGSARCRTPPKINFVRTVGTDWQLLEALRHELDLRGAWPGCRPEIIPSGDGWWTRSGRAVTRWTTISCW